MERTIHFALFATVLLWNSGCGSAPSTEPAAPEPAITSATMPDSIHLIATNGRYVCADLGATDQYVGVLLANREQASQWETFAVKDLGAGKVALVAANGKYVSADRSLGGRVKADRDVAGDWETFELVDQPNGGLSLRTTEGRYVCADLGLTGWEQGMLVANRDSAAEWETFRVERAKRQ